MKDREISWRVWRRTTEKGHLYAPRKLMLKNIFEYNSFSFGISFSRNGKIFSVSVLSVSAEKKRENSKREILI